MISLFMFYDEDRHLELSRTLRNASEELKKVGAELRLADFQDI